MSVERSMPKPFVPAMVFLVLIRTPLATAQSLDEPRLFTYVRLGGAVVMADDVQRTPAVGFGIRGETESFAIDVSGLNFALSYDARNPAREIAVGSLLKIEGLKFFSPEREGSAYIGGGLSWGYISVGRASRSGGSDTSWDGRGLQGEFTVGYELPRSSGIRFLVQADASLPLFSARSTSYAYPSPGIVESTGRDRLVIPSVVLSMGVGWRRLR
jgi:hypothetical protein